MALPGSSASMIQPSDVLKGPKIEHQKVQALSQSLEKENFPDEESETLSDRDAEPLVSTEGLKFIVLTLDDDSKEDLLPCIPEFNLDEIEE